MPSTWGVTPFEVLVDPTTGDELPLPKALGSVYGPLRLGSHGGAPAVFANFASTLDGVVTFPGAGSAPGRAITGPDPHDRFLLGLLRASSGAIVVGAGTVRASPRHLWTAARAFPDASAAFRQLRHRLGYRKPAPTFVVTARGAVDPRWSLFSSSETEGIVITTPRGARRISRSPGGSRLSVLVAGSSARLRAGEVLRAVQAAHPSSRVLLEGGPRLMSQFLADRQVGELFLTLAPQIAGRTPGEDRPGLAEGQRFLPRRSVWGAVTGIRLGGDLVFLRTGFRPGPVPK